MHSPGSAGATLANVRRLSSTMSCSSSPTYSPLSLWTCGPSKLSDRLAVQVIDEASLPEANGTPAHVINVVDHHRSPYGFIVAGEDWT